jgi:hypothetical protein
MGVEVDEDEEAIRGHTLSALDRDSEFIAAAWAEGRQLDLAGAVALAYLD